MVATDGRKGRKKLFVVENDAQVVRLIYDLADVGLTGQPMGSRAIAAHLNSNGYTFRGKRFFHSNVDGILTREHYGGFYRDRTMDAKGVKPTEAEAIVVTCPQIVAPDQIARVAAIRARAAPSVTPPRITNSPVMLGGIATCGHPECGSGMVLRTGKGGPIVITSAIGRRPRVPRLAQARRSAKTRSTVSCSRDCSVAFCSPTG